MNTNAENVAKNLSCSRGWAPLTKELVVQNVALQSQLSSSQCSHYQVPAALNAKVASVPPVKSLRIDSCIALLDIAQLIPMDISAIRKEIIEDVN
jgi:hypothetical protein